MNPLKVSTVRPARLGLRCLLAGGAMLASVSAHAADGAYGPAVFDVDVRRGLLQQPEYAPALAACMAAEAEEVLPIADPIAGLGPTDEYGTDNRAEAFSWSIMVLAGRSLAGDAVASESLIDGLVAWAEADALGETPTHYDPFYATKRVMLPTMVAFRIAADDMTPDQRELVERWIDGIVRRLDATFDGDVDHNNHRYLADAALMTWGSIVGDAELIDKGVERFNIALGQARADGSLPLEARRGARAMWYTNMSTGELALMAQVAALNGIDLTSGDGKAGFQSILDYLGTVLVEPALIFPYAAQNYIPGPTADYRLQDVGFMETRGHQRHYMAWTELGHQPVLAAYDISTIEAFRDLELAPVRPLIDDYAGGNATCFWWEPNGADLQ